MSGWLAALAAIALLALFIRAAIRADRRDQDAYDRWYADPRHIWNQREEWKP